MTKARDIADFKFENIVDTGTEGTKVASGTTAQRGSTTGQWRYNTTTGFFEGRNTDGTYSTLEPTPTIISTDITEVDSAGGGNITIRVTGTNFTSGGTIKFIGNNASEITASSSTFINSSNYDAVVAKSSFSNALEPYDVRFISASGLQATLDDNISVDNSPSWNTASGTLATIYDTATGTHATVSATDADGDTITYSETGGTVLSTNNFSLNSSTGAISGDPVNVVSPTTHSFTLRATANSKTSDRNFNIIVNPALDGSTSARSASSAQSLYDLGITTAGAYYVTVNGSPKLTYCDFFNSEGWILVGNLKANYYSDTNWTWNDYTSWRRSGSSFGSVSAPFSSSTTTQYRDATAYEHYNGTKVAIKVHNFGTMFGSGSYIAFELLPAYQNGSWLDFMSLSGGSGGGRQITSAYYAQAGMATSGSIGATSGYATNLDYCPISRSVGASGHLRANHHLDNNACRLLMSHQYLETSNTDETRGLAQAYGFNGGIEDQETSFNSIVTPWCNGTGSDNSSGNFLESYRQFGSGQFPDNSNASAYTNPSPYSGADYHYALYIK
jgi:hypothetical protein